MRLSRCFLAHEHRIERHKESFETISLNLTLNSAPAFSPIIVNIQPTDPNSDPGAQIQYIHSSQFQSRSENNKFQS